MILISVAIIGAMLGGVGILIWLGAQERRQIESELKRIDNLTEETARSLALDLLEDPNVFDVKPATGVRPEVSLPDSVSEVLDRYEEVARGEFWIGRAALLQKPRRAGFVKIGEDCEFEEILVRLGDQRVFLDYGHLADDESPETVSTLWHEVLKVSGVKVPLTITSAKVPGVGSQSVV